jgi:hypothetical protein
MSQSLEELQAVLAERIVKLDEERKNNALQQSKEREGLLLEMELERKQRLEEYQAKVAVHEAKRRAEEESKEAQRVKETAERMAAEQKQNALDEALILQREKLEWLTTAISNAEFSEDQHRKSMENLRVLPSVEPTGTEVSAEYPQTCADGGASAEGTEGSTPENQSMSSHLREILRQAQRD